MLFTMFQLCSSYYGPHLSLVGRVRHMPMATLSAVEETRGSVILKGLSDEESSVVLWLSSEQMGQAHLFEGWEAAATSDKRRLLTQLLELDARYPVDVQGRVGLEAYIAHARELLTGSADNTNPFDGYVVEIPEGERMQIGSDAFRSDERLGMRVIQDAVFVLVAGGLGERLGFNGIKVELPSETCLGESFLASYISALLAIQEMGDPSRPVPLVIMTSEDTDTRTRALLESNGGFGMPMEQIHIITQANVPAVADNQARLVLSASDPFKLQTKPHGHGDVHTLLFQSGLLPRFEREGRKYMVFFQDTNVLAFRAIPAALGVSERNGLAMNSLTVPRYAGEPAGAICRLVRPAEVPLVINVEYNQLDALLRTSGQDGDAADDSGKSPYPANCNTFILSLGPYARALEATSGTMPEFVNPKYTDASRTSFKKPTRLECMMQDIPRLLAAGDRVGFTDFDRWFSFSPIKNSIDQALKAHADGVYAASPGAAEEKVYRANAALLRLAGATVESAPPREYLGLPLALQPAIAMTPRFALTVDALIARVPTGASVTISSRSTLLLDGDVTLHELQLDGTLVVRAARGVQVHIIGCAIHNAGWVFVPLKADSVDVPPPIAIRGYRVSKLEAVEIEITEPGNYQLVGNGVVRKV